MKRQRNRLSKKDDIETALEKMLMQYHAKQRSGFKSRAAAMLPQMAMMRIMQQWENAQWAEYGPEMLPDKVYITAVSDGDSLTGEKQTASGKEIIQMRLYGIDAPDKRQAFGKEAWQFLESLCLNKTLYYDPVSGSDRFRRVIAIAWMPENRMSVNALMLKNGMAWLDPVHCQRRICRRWDKIQAAAQAKRIGLWSDKNAVPPWVFSGGTDD
jgi:endonuclease YncB( thermonuclease family)